MTVYLDNDTIKVLVAGDLVDQALTALGASRADVRVLPTAKFVLRRKLKPLAARLEDFFRTVVPLGTAPAVDDMVGENLDAGELILFASAAADVSSVMVTGDKRALKALVTSSKCARLVEQLKGRVMCTSQLLLATLDRCGLKEMVERMVPSGFGYDTETQAIFGSGLRAEERNVRAALDAFILPVEQAAGGLLRPR